MSGRTCEESGTQEREEENLYVGDDGLQEAAPVDQAGGSIDEAFIVKPEQHHGE
jgi:hypothetical protein